MNLLLPRSLALGFALAGLAAQVSGRAQAPAGTPGQAETSRPAAATKGAARAAIVVPLKEVSDAQVAPIRESLRGIKLEIYECTECTFTQRAKGTCPDCELALEATQLPIVSKADIDVPAKTLTIGLEQQRGLKLSELERALKKSGAKLDRSAIRVASFTQLVIKGETSKEAAAELEKALGAAKLFATFTVGLQEDGKAIRLFVTDAGPNPPTLAALSGAVDQVTPKLRLDDLLWTGPCAACAKKGMSVASCKACAAPASARPDGI
jgi:hypothetical protein